MVPVAVRQGTRRICLTLPKIKMQVNPELWRNQRIYKMSSLQFFNGFDYFYTILPKFQ